MTDFQRGRAFVLLSIPIPAIAYATAPVAWSLQKQFYPHHVGCSPVVKLGMVYHLAPKPQNGILQKILELLCSYDYHLAFILAIIPCGYLFATGSVFLLRSHRESCQ